MGRFGFGSSVWMIPLLLLLLLLLLLHVSLFSPAVVGHIGVQPLSKIAIHRATLALHPSANISASPALLGVKGEDTELVTVEFTPPLHLLMTGGSMCPPENAKDEAPYICSAPIKYKYANYSDSNYSKMGKASLEFRLINQRADFSFGLFSGGLSNPKLVAVSNSITFANPKAPLYPRHAQGKAWDEMTVTWTSGYNKVEAVPLVQWGLKGETQSKSPAGTLTFNRNSMCGSPARDYGWRDPGFIHTGSLKNLWPNAMYTYRVGHLLANGSYVWGKSYSFRSSPYPSQDSLQRVIVFGDMGKAERDGSNEYNNDKPGSLNTTDQLVKDLKIKQ